MQDYGVTADQIVPIDDSELQRRTAARMQVSDQPPEAPAMLASTEKPLSETEAENGTQAPGQTESQNEEEQQETETMTTTTQPQPKTYGSVLHVDTNGFQHEVLDTDAPVLVDFYADWCGPCRRLAPTLDQLARQRPDAKVVKVNIDKSPELAARYRVESIPTVIVFKQGKVASRQTGLVNGAALERMLGG
jgi:thioredoxin 1